MIARPTAVKHSQGDQQNRPQGGRVGSGHSGQRVPRARFGWLEGWALILPSVGLALIAALLAVPRATAPRWVPEPLVRPHILAVDLKHAAGLAVQARTRPLPYAVRELGELYRRLGRLQHDNAEPLVAVQVRAWQERLRTVQARVGNAPVLQLRALQCELLAAAIQHWQSTGVVNDDLIELGGDLVRVVGANSLSEPERWALALKRWTSLAGLGSHAAFRVSREIELTQLHFFYRHPNREDEPLDTRVRILRRYGEIDPNYPMHYALGVLFSLNGRIDMAFAFFSKHLENHPDGAFYLRARNHLIWAARQLGSASDHERR